MIAPTNVLGIPLRKISERRCFVLGYYIVFTVLAILWFQVSGMIWSACIGAILLFFVSGVIHRVRKEGAPSYREPMLVISASNDLYPLEILRPPNRGQHSYPSDLHTDERETSMKNQAFRQAYGILSIMLFILPLVWVAHSIGWFSISGKFVLPIMVSLVNFVLTLPRAVLLWNQPNDLGKAEPTLMMP